MRAIVPAGVPIRWPTPVDRGSPHPKADPDEKPSVHIEPFSGLSGIFDPLVDPYSILATADDQIDPLRLGDWLGELIAYIRLDNWVFDVLARSTNPQSRAIVADLQKRWAAWRRAGTAIERAAYYASRVRDDRGGPPLPSLPLATADDDEVVEYLRQLLARCAQWAEEAGLTTAGAAPSVESSEEKIPRQRVARDDAKSRIQNHWAQLGSQERARATRDSIAAATGVSAGLTSQLLHELGIRTAGQGNAEPKVREISLTDSMTAVIPAGQNQVNEEDFAKVVDHIKKYGVDNLLEVARLHADPEATPSEDARRHT